MQRDIRGGGINLALAPVEGEIDADIAFICIYAIVARDDLVPCGGEFVGWDFYLLIYDGLSAVGALVAEEEVDILGEMELLVCAGVAKGSCSG